MEPHPKGPGRPRHACAGNSVHSPELVPRPKCRLFLCWSWKFRTPPASTHSCARPLGLPSLRMPRHWQMETQAHAGSPGVRVADHTRVELQECMCIHGPREICHEAIYRVVGRINDRCRAWRRRGPEAWSSPPSLRWRSCHSLQAAVESRGRVIFAHKFSVARHFSLVSRLLDGVDPALRPPKSSRGPASPSLPLQPCQSLGVLACSPLAHCRRLLLPGAHPTQAPLCW